MPKLPTYAAKIGDAAVSGGRRAAAEDFGEGVNSGLIAAGHRIQSATLSFAAEMEEQEARKALVASTQIRADYARKLDEAALSGADVGKIKEQMVSDLTKVGESFQTKKGVDQIQLYTANSEIMFDKQASQIAVQRAWSEAKLQGSAFVNSASALIQSNPLYLQAAEKDAADFVASFPRIRPDQRAELTRRLQQDLNMAAAMSAARLDPPGAQTRLDAGEWNLTPEQRNTARLNAEKYGNIKRQTEDREIARKKQEREERKDEAETDLTRRIFSNEVGKKIYDEITSSPYLDAGALRRVQATLEQRTKDLQGGETAAKTDPRVFNNLRELIDLPQTDTRKPKSAGEIWAFYGKGLTEASARALETRWRDNRSESGQRWSAAESELIRNLRPQLDKSTMVSSDAGGGARVQAFTQHLRDKVEEYKTQKKDP